MTRERVTKASKGKHLLRGKERRKGLLLHWRLIIHLNFLSDVIIIFCGRCNPYPILLNKIVSSQTLVIIEFSFLCPVVVHANTGPAEQTKTLQLSRMKVAKLSCCHCNTEPNKSFIKQGTCRSRALGSYFVTKTCEKLCLPRA